MKFLLLLFPILAFAQNIPSDQVKIGRPQTSADKELIFDTNDGVSNKKLSVEKTSKRLKWDGNSVQIGDGAATNKEILFNGTSGKALIYDSTATEFRLNDDLGINGFGLKTNSIDTFSGNETSLEKNGRVKGHLHIGTGANRLRVSGGNLEFTNDGTIFKKIGSGSGGGEGGLNLATNPSFEDGAGNWTATGGTYSIQPYSLPSENNLSYARFIASGAGQKLCSDAIVVPDSLTGGCLAYSQYKTTNNNAFELEILSASNIINRAVLPTTNGAWLRTPSVAVLCPVSGQNIQVCYDSLTAGAIEVDQVYKGSENRTASLSQSEFFGSVVYPATAGCNFNVTSTSYSNTPVQASCPTATVNGKIIAPSQKTISFRLPAGSRGAFLVNFYGRFAMGTTTLDGESFARFSDGTNHYGDVFVADGNGITNTALGYLNSISTTINLQNALLVDTEFTMQLRTSNASNASGLNCATSSCQIEVFRFPNGSESAVTNQQSGWFIDANIGGANPSLGTADVTTYTEITNAALDMVLRSGSAPASIPCSGTNPSTGLTCSAGNEGVGVVFTPPYSGYFDVCFDFSHFTSSGGASGSFVYAAFQSVLTQNSAQTILQEGGERKASGGNYEGAANSQQMQAANKTCSTFLFSDTAQKTVRLMYEQDVSGTNLSELVADRSASVGQRDIRVTVRPSTMNIARPVLTGDTVTSPNAVKPVLCSAKISATGVISDQLGGCFASCTNAVASVCTFTASYWAANPTCSLIAGSTGGSQVDTNGAQVLDLSSTAATFAIINAAGSSQVARNKFVICHGQAQ